METPANLQISIQKGDRVISLDLSDAYLHLPIHPSSTTREVDTMMAYVRSLSLQIDHYVDDWLSRNQQV